MTCGYSTTVNFDVDEAPTQDRSVDISYETLGRTSDAENVRPSLRLDSRPPYTQRSTSISTLPSIILTRSASALLRRKKKRRSRYRCFLGCILSASDDGDDRADVSRAREEQELYLAPETIHSITIDCKTLDSITINFDTSDTPKIEIRSHGERMAQESFDATKHYCANLSEVQSRRNSGCTFVPGQQSRRSSDCTVVSGELVRRDLECTFLAGQQSRRGSACSNVAVRQLRKNSLCNMIPLQQVSLPNYHEVYNSLGEQSITMSTTTEEWMDGTQDRERANAAAANWKSKMDDIGLHFSPVLDCQTV